MSTIAKTTPTRSGCLGVLPLRRPKVSSKASQSPRPPIIAIAERLGNFFNNGHIYDANKLSNTNFSYSFLFAISKARDIDSARKRILSGGRTTVTFAASATNISGVVNGDNSRTMYLFSWTTIIHTMSLGWAYLEAVCSISPIRLLVR